MHCYSASRAGCAGSAGFRVSAGAVPRTGTASVDRVQLPPPPPPKKKNACETHDSCKSWLHVESVYVNTDCADGRLRTVGGGGFPGFPPFGLLSRW